MPTMIASGAVTNVALLGVGNRLRGLIGHVFQRFPEHPLRFTDVWEPSDQAWQDLIDLLGYQPRRFMRAEDALADAQTDWAFVGSLNALHREHAVAALRAGKHLFLEKPIATNLDDALEIRRVWRESGRLCLFGFCLRYAPHFRRIKEILASGELGELISFEFNETLHFDHGGYIMGNWRRMEALSGGHLLEKCCHDFDIVNWLVGIPPLRAASFGGRNFFLPGNAGLAEAMGRSVNGRPAFQSWPDYGPNSPFDGKGDIVDNQVAILEFANGIRATFHTNLSSSLPERRLYVMGTKGTLRADAVAGRIEFSPLGYSGLRREEFTGETQGHTLADQRLVDQLVDVIRTGDVPATGIEEGIRAAAVAWGIEQARQTGSVFDFTPLWARVEA